MLNLLTKTKPWMVASLFVATALFGQDNGNGACPAPCPKPCPPKCEPACPKPCPPKCKPECPNPCPPKCEPVCPKPCCPKPCPPPCPPKPCPKPCLQPCPPTQICPPECPDPCCPTWPTPVLNAAYNYPARTLTRCPWNVFFEGSFIYWQPIQENMELGFVTTTASTAVSVPGFLNGNFIGMDFSYKPGFKVAAGMAFDYDNWEMRAEYTWFHGTHSQSSSQVATAAVIKPLLGHPGVVGTTNYSSASESWRLKMDLIDLDLGRNGYVGTRLTLRPFFGARAAWIRQNLHATYTATGPVFTTPGTASVSMSTTNWGIGPRAGLNSDWKLGEGFRLAGKGAADILYTRYNKLREHDTFVSPAGVLGNNINTSQKKYGALRTHLELEMGLGWGTYLDCNNWYMDLYAGYTFQAFFNQNAFRHFFRSTADAASAIGLNATGDLYVHGLTTTFRVDF